MKKLLLSICAILVLCLPISLSSCSSEKAEQTISDMGYGDWDINGDGQAGREINFRGGHVHVDDKLPWNECDICSKHKVYW